MEASAAADELDGIAKQVKAVHERVEQGQEEAEGEQEEGGDEPAADEEHDAGEDAAPLEVSAVLARRSARTLGELSEALESWYDHYDEYEPGFSWWAASPYEAAHEALEAYAKLLREEVAGQKDEDDDPLLGDPVGREALLDDLAHELIPYTPEQLLAIGEEQLAWCERQMLVAADELGYGEDWKAALAHVKGLAQEPGGQDDLVAAQAREAVAFLDERDLVTIPDLCRETWRVEMISEEGQRTLPFAAYGGQHMLVAYPTAGMDHESKRMSMRGNNIHFTRIVTPHELIPGHHLQGFMARRHRAYREPFQTPFLGEGWALYWEMVLWEKGWPRGPEDRVGMLFWRMHRAARILVSLRFHLGAMTPQQMIDFLVERVGHEHDGATSEVRRYIGGGYGPLYQCAYMIGGLQLRALREELVGAGALTERQFHDAVLRQNAIPVEMIRAALSGRAPAREHRASWRFAGEVEPSTGAENGVDGGR